MIVNLKMQPVISNFTGNRLATNRITSLVYVLVIFARDVTLHL